MDENEILNIIEDIELHLSIFKENSYRIPEDVACKLNEISEQINDLINDLK